MRSKAKWIKYSSSIFLMALWFVNTSVGAQDADNTQAASHVVTGVVRDAHTKEPISAAQIQSLSYPASATTDTLGEFKITIADKNDVLQVTAFDYDIREFSLRGNTEVVIDLYSDVFTDLYKSYRGVSGKVKKSHAVKSAESIEEVADIFAITADDVIQSKLNGNVRAISRSGTVGVGSALFIRGFNSLNANAQPLFVVDGVIWNNTNDVNSIHGGYFSNPLANIDVSDIESITVLKDGTSIYGSKAANGVVLIATTRGKGVVTKINLNATYGITTEPGSIPMMDAEDHRIYISEILGTQNTNQSFMINPGFLDDDPSTTYYSRYHNNTNWNDEVYQLGRTQSYNINVNGGDDKALYYFSLGYTNNQGIVKTTDMERLHTRFNADFNMSKVFKFGLNVSYSNIDRSLLDDGVNLMSSPTYLSKIKAPFLYPFEYTNDGSVTLDYEDADEFNVGNPSAIIEKSLNTSKHYRFNIGAIPKFIFSPSLSLQSHFDYSLDKTVEAHFTPMLGMGTFTYNVSITNRGVIENRVKNQVLRNVAVFDETRLDYNKDFGSHSLKGILGWRYLSSYLETDNVLGYNTGTDDTRNFTGNLEYQVVNGTNIHLKSLSNYLNVDYNYDQRFFVNATASLDGSSRFGSETEGGIQLMGHSWGFFPGINAAWLLSSENFMENVGAVNYLKLRLGYNITGNDDISDYTNLTYFMSESYIDRTTGIYLANIANNSIQWETTARQNVGLDMNLFNERIALSVDLYSSKTTDLLTLNVAPEVSGLGYYYTNGGELSNMGYEVNSTIKLLNLNAFKWELGVSVGHYKNELISLPINNRITRVFDGYVINSVGEAAGVFYGYKTDGVFVTDAESVNADLIKQEANGSFTRFGAGDVKFIDKDENHIIDSRDMEIIGDPNPDLYGSFRSQIAIKKLTLSAMFSYSYGNDVYNYLRHKLESGNNYYNQTTAMLTRWTVEGQETVQPRAVYGDPMGNARFSDRWIEDGSYLKLKSLMLSYDVPLSGGFIEGLNIWVSANNLWTMSNYLGLDPEFSAGNSVLLQGVDAGLLPLTKSYFVGVKLNL